MKHLIALTMLLTVSVAAMFGTRYLIEQVDRPGTVWLILQGHPIHSLNAILAQEGVTLNNIWLNGRIVSLRVANMRQAVTLSDHTWVRISTSALLFTLPACGALIAPTQVCSNCRMTLVQGL